MGTETTSCDSRVFERTMKDYLRVCTRTFQSAINTKAYYVARKAIWFTAKADKTKLKSELARVVISKRKGTVKLRMQTVTRYSRFGLEVQAPLVALIINKRLGKGRGLQGQAMTDAIVRFMGARMKSVAFIKSGWLPAVKALAPFADKAGEPAIDSTARQIGQVKGSATPAEEGFNPTAVLWNHAGENRGNNGALLKYGGGGLQRAFDDETASMQDYIEKKMQPDADRFNSQQK